TCPSGDVQLATESMLSSGVIGVAKASATMAASTVPPPRAASRAWSARSSGSIAAGAGTLLQAESRRAETAAESRRLDIGNGPSTGNGSCHGTAGLFALFVTVRLQCRLRREGLR